MPSVALGEESSRKMRWLAWVVPQKGVRRGVPKQDWDSHWEDWGHCFHLLLLCQFNALKRLLFISVKVEPRSSNQSCCGQTVSGPRSSPASKVGDGYGRRQSDLFKTKVSGKIKNKPRTHSLCTGIFPLSLCLLPTMIAMSGLVVDLKAPTR